MVLLVGRYGIAVLAWAGTLVIARQLSTTAWGGFSFIFSLLGIIGVVSDLKVGRIVLAEILESGDRPSDVVRSYVTMRALVGVLAYAVALLVVVVGGYPDEVVHGTAVAGLVLVVAGTSAAIDVFLNAGMRMRPQAVASVLGQVAQLALTLAIAVGGAGSLVRFCVPAVLFEAVAIGWKLRVVSPAVRLRPRVEPARWGAWLREAAPLAVGGAMSTLYFRIDSVMLSKLDTLEAVGIYAIGYKFSDLVGYIPIAVCTPVLTLMVAAWPDDERRFARAFDQAYVVLAVLGIGAAIGFAAFAGPLVSLLYGARFLPGVNAARALVLAQTLHFLGALCYFTLLAAGRNRPYVVATFLGVVVNVALNLVLIPRLSYDGAAIATVVTEVAVVGVLAGATRRLPGVRLLRWDLLGRLTLAGLATAGVVVATTGRLPWPLAAGLAAVAYLGTVEALRTGGGLRTLLRATEPAR